MVNEKITILDFDLEKINCDLCGCNVFFDIAKKDRYQINVTGSMCSNCGLVMLNPRPRKEWFDDFYKHDYRKIYESQETPDSNYISKPRRVIKHLTNIEIIQKYIDLNNKKVLDIGSAEGLFLSKIREKYPNASLTGIESNVNFSHFSRTHYGFSDIRTGSFFDVVKTDDSFDFIYCSHVLEHILEPNQFLQICFQILNKHGMLFIDVPDVSTSRKGNQYFHIAHAYYYSINTLSQLLEANGFNCMYISNQNRYHSPKKEPWTIQVMVTKRPVDKTDRYVDNPFSGNQELLRWLKTQWSN